MPVTFNEKLLAYLALISGLVISVVAEYYSILGLTAIFAAAVIPVVIMGIALGIGKITATLWLKQNWSIAHWSIKLYLVSAIAVLMLITSMGIFGFLSKAHSEQSLVSGDVLAKLAVYDEKINIAKENIEVNRKAIKQLDDAVDQVMSRSTSEAGADKANQIRRSQTRDRARLLSEISAEQKTIATLNEEAAPIRAEIRKIEAEVGPIKYIANFVYGETDPTILEKAVTWVIIILIVVFDPLALILLLSSQISFQNFRDREKEIDWQGRTEELLDVFDNAPDPWVADVGEKPTAEELKDDLFPTYEEITPKEGDSPKDSVDVVKEQSTVTTSTVTEAVIEPSIIVPPVDKEPIRTVITGNRPNQVTKVFKAPPKTMTTVTEEIVQQALEDTIAPTVILEKDTNYVIIDGQRYNRNSVPAVLRTYVQNEEQRESGVWSAVKKNEE